MKNRLIAYKMKGKNYEKIISLSNQTKNLFPTKITNNNRFFLKIQLKSPIRKVYINKLRKNKTKEMNNLSKMQMAYELDNYKNNIGIINYNLMQQNNYLIHSNKLINNISNLNKSCKDKSKILPDIRNIKTKYKSLNQTNAKLDINLKKIYLGDLSKNDEENEEIKNDNEFNFDKNKFEGEKINKKEDRVKLKKLLLLRNTTNYKLENNNETYTTKNDINRNAKLLKKFYIQKIMNYDRLIKEMEEESEIKKNKMDEYINLMKKNFENGF